MARARLIGTKRSRDGSKYYQGRSGTTARQRRRIGRRIRRSDKIATSGYKYHIQRWQASSPSYLGPGLYKIGTFQDSPGYTILPIHFMSLTNVGILGNANSAKGCFNDIGMNYFFRNDSTNEFSYASLVSQTNNGALAGTQWRVEQSEVYGELGFARRVFHDWTDIRLNLYGTFSVPITYTVYVMTMKEQLDPNQFPPLGTIPQHVELGNMVKDITRQCTGNSVASNGRTDWPRDVRILKKQVVTLQPLNYSDQAAQVLDLGSALPSHTPNVHELRLFVSHRRFRDYKWSENNVDDTTNNVLDSNGWDINAPQNLMCDVEWGKRVFLFVTATCPQVSPYVPGPDQLLANADSARVMGSYDINVRNKFRFEE